jgi:DNA transformation protein and related proteins
MPVTPTFREYVLEQLRRVLPAIRARSMFGGVGIYSGEFFFALIDNETVYFKMSDLNRADFEARGLGPFRPFGDDGEAMQYYEIPTELLEDIDSLRPWAETAVQVARLAKRKKR